MHTDLIPLPSLGRQPILILKLLNRKEFEKKIRAGWKRIVKHSFVIFEQNWKLICCYKNNTLHPGTYMIFKFLAFQLTTLIFRSIYCNSNKSYSPYITFSEEKSKILTFLMLSPHFDNSTNSYSYCNIIVSRQQHSECC